MKSFGPSVFLGGTGFVGSEVVAELRRRWPQEEIVIVSRREPNPLPPQLKGIPDIRWICADIIEKEIPPELQGILSKARALFYSVQFPGHPIENPKRGHTYLNYDFGGLQKVLRVLNPEARVMYVSGAGAGKGFQEQWYRAKDQAESLLRDRFAQNPASTFLSLRPSVIFGPEDVSLNKLIHIARQTGVCPLFDGGRVELYPIFVKDLGRVFVELGWGSELVGSFDFPGPEKISFRKLLEKAFRAKNLAQPIFLSAPTSLAKLGAGLISWLPKPPITADAIQFLTFGPKMVSPLDLSHQSKAPESLGLNPLVKAWQGLTPLDSALV